MKKMTVAATALLALWLISCGGGKSIRDNDAISMGAPDVKKVDSWSNPTFKGGKTKMATTEGIAEVNRKGVGAARDEAILDAQRKAVQEVVGSFISSEAMTENNALISKQITDKSSGYIANYKIAEEKRDGDAYWVKITAEVGMDMIQDNLAAMGLLIDKMNLPMLVMLVKESGVDADKSEFECNAFSTEIEKLMSERGFRFVDRDMLKSVLAKENIRFSELGGAQLAGVISKIGVGTGAQVALVGTARSQFFTKIGTTTMKSYRASGGIKVVNVADATTIAQENLESAGTAGVPGVGGSDQDAANTALQKGAQMIAPKIIAKVSKAWQDIQQSGTEFTLLISGLSFDDQIKVEEEMPKTFRNVKKVFNKGMLGDASKMLVRYLGSARDLAVDLRKNGGLMGFEFQILNMDEKTVTVKAAKKGN
ncbi:MAG: hypothetical protein HZC28_01780 [Spirochaetes bacterium]|nr:hypothetical protein [Spirochaetota bacterium]